MTNISSGSCAGPLPIRRCARTSAHLRRPGYDSPQSAFARTRTSGLHPPRNSENMLPHSLQIAISISPWFEKNPEKQATDFTDSHRCCPLVSRSVPIRVNPWLSPSLFLLLVLYIHIFRVYDASAFLCFPFGRCFASGSAA